MILPIGVVEIIYKKVEEHWFNKHKEKLQPNLDFIKSLRYQTKGFDFAFMYFLLYGKTLKIEKTIVFDGVVGNGIGADVGLYLMDDFDN